MFYPIFRKETWLLVWRTDLFQAFIHNIDQCTNIDLSQIWKIISNVLAWHMRTNGVIWASTWWAIMYLCWSQFICEYKPKSVHHIKQTCLTTRFIWIICTKKILGLYKFGKVFGCMDFQCLNKKGTKINHSFVFRRWVMGLWVWNGMRVSKCWLNFHTWVN